MYLANNTRPDIEQAVTRLARYMERPTKVHLEAAKRVLRYLKGTKEFGLSYRRCEEPKLEGFADASWAEQSLDRRSTTGYLFMKGGNAVVWTSRKQSIVALSTSEAEYVAISDATREGVWLRQLYFDMGVQMGPTVIWEDNQTCINMTEVSSSKRSKHIDIKYHYIREKIQNEEIKVKYLQTTEMIADILTKPLPRVQFEYLREKFSIKKC
jgi:hypothetical protein